MRAIKKFTSGNIPAISLQPENQEDRDFLQAFINTNAENNYQFWIHSWGMSCGKVGYDYVYFGWLSKEKLKGEKMNLRTDEIGQAENTLKELYESLVNKKNDIDVQYQKSREETNRLDNIRNGMGKELRAIAAAYKEITGKEL